MRSKKVKKSMLWDYDAMGSCLLSEYIPTVLPDSLKYIS